MKIRDIDQKDEEYQKRLAKMVMKDYFVIFEIGTAICLPDSEDYKIRVSCGEEYWETDTPKQGKDQKMERYCRWSFRNGNGDGY